MRVVFSANILTNETKQHRKIHNSIQFNKPKQLNTEKLTQIK